jgi:hypothetical protein
MDAGGRSCHHRNAGVASEQVTSKFAFPMHGAAGNGGPVHCAAHIPLASPGSAAAIAKRPWNESRGAAFGLYGGRTTTAG